jgi:hypothetical protein
MNEIYKTPLLTTWPIPVDFRECFARGEKVLKNKAKNEVKKTNHASFSLNLLSVFY